MPPDNASGSTLPRPPSPIETRDSRFRTRLLWSKSLRFRLTIWYGSLLALVLTAAAISLHTAGRKFFVSRQDALISANTFYIARIAKGKTGAPRDATSIIRIWETAAGTSLDSPEAQIETSRMHPDSRIMMPYIVYVRILDSKSRATLAMSTTLRRRPDLTAHLDAMLRRNEAYATFDAIADSHEDRRIRVHEECLNIDGNATVLQVAVNWGAPLEILRHFALVLVIGVPAIVGLAMLVGWRMVSRTLQPIGRIVAQARLLDVDSLPRRLLAAPQETDSELGQLVGTLNDMTTRLHQAFEAQNRYAETKVRFAAAQQRFVADASHELRTPLTILRGEIELALVRPRGVDDYRATLDSALEEIRRMGRIVDGLTALARGDAGAILSRDSFESVDMLDIACRAVGDFRKRAALKGITLQLQHKYDGPRRATIEGDPGLLQQLLCNLVENAVKYTLPGGTVTISISMSRSSATLEDSVALIEAGKLQDNVVVEVQDTGIGIAVADLPYIGERFWRADRSRAAGGSGLGLAICAQIIEAHGGRMAIESRLEKGSTFSVFLPLAGCVSTT